MAVEGSDVCAAGGWGAGEVVPPPPCYLASVYCVVSFVGVAGVSPVAVLGDGLASTLDNVAPPIFCGLALPTLCGVTKSSLLRDYCTQRL